MMYKLTVATLKKYNIILTKSTELDIVINDNHGKNPYIISNRPKKYTFCHKVSKINNFFYEGAIICRL